jgi:uncharacterized protein (TIGR02145 family)
MLIVYFRYGSTHVFYKKDAFVNVLKPLLRALFSLPAFIVLSAFGVQAKDTVTDADGNIYTTVKIGNQVWTVENLRTTKYNDGAPIPLITGQSEWSACDDNKRPAYCWYRNDTGNKTAYGALYNWYAVNTGKLAPKGWHVSTDAEWTELEDYLIDNGYNWDTTGDSRAAAKSMAAGTEWAWTSNTNPGAIGSDVSKNNRSGFSALPGGVRLVSGNFRNVGTTGRWWSATEHDTSRAWRFNLRYDSGALNRDSFLKGCGFSVRLLRD